MDETWDRVALRRWDGTGVARRGCDNTFGRYCDGESLLVVTWDDGEKGEADCWFVDNALCTAYE